MKEQKRETQESCGTEVRLRTRRLEKMKKERGAGEGRNRGKREEQE